jgi:hypothetical protein
LVDDSGIATVVACHRAAAVGGRALRLKHVAPGVRREFYTAGLIGLLGITDVPPAEVAAN